MVMGNCTSANVTCSMHLSHQYCQLVTFILPGKYADDVF